MNQLILQAAQQYKPEHRQQFVEYIRNEPMAAAQLRAPLFEDKVVDFLFGKAEISRARREPRRPRNGDRIRGRPCPRPGLRSRPRHDHSAAKPKAKAKKAAAPKAEAAATTELAEKLVAEPKKAAPEVGAVASAERTQKPAAKGEEGGCPQGRPRPRPSPPKKPAAKKAENILSCDAWGGVSAEGRGFPGTVLTVSVSPSTTLPGRSLSIARDGEVFRA